MAAVQAAALVEAVTAIAAGEAALSAVLDSHVAAGCVLPAVPERLEELWQANADTAPRVARYVLLALHAAACAATDMEDPLRAEWVAHFVNFALQVSDGIVDEPVRAAFEPRPRPGARIGGRADAVERRLRSCCSATCNRRNASTRR